MTASKKVRKTCVHCGGGYETVNPKGDYCSTKCRVAAYRVRSPRVKKERKLPEKNTRRVMARTPRAFLELLRAVGEGGDSAGLMEEVRVHPGLTPNQREMLYAKIKNLIDG